MDVRVLITTDPPVADDSADSRTPSSPSPSDGNLISTRGDPDEEEVEEEISSWSNRLRALQLVF
jgi:hypothetical protein